MRRLNVLLFVCSLTVTTAPAATQAASVEEAQITTSARTALGVTIYNDSQALVRDTRKLNLKSGVNRIAFRDVAATIRPETASFRSTAGPGFSLIEQNFDFDLLTPAALLQKYVGREVSVIRTNPATGAETSESATVLANNDGVVLRYADRIETGIPGRIAFGKVPANLRDRPTLSILLAAHRDGPQEAELMYLANNIGWKADYNATLDADGRKMSLAGWVTLTNGSGTDYEDAKLQLVAGTLNRARQSLDYRTAGAPMAAAKALAMEPIKEEKLFEYHLYTVDQPMTMLNNQTKQVALLSATSIPVTREYVIQQPGNFFWYYQGSHPEIQKGIKPGVFIRFENKDGDLGKPLPGGTVRVYQRDSMGGAQLVGEDALAHTAKGEKVALKMGDAFDLTADRVQTDYKSLSSRSSQSSYRVEIRNADPKPVTVTVREPLHGDWNITAENLPHLKESAGSAVWNVVVPGYGEGGKATLEYTATVKW
jgi:hypothetical protein